MPHFSKALAMSNCRRVASRMMLIVSKKIAKKKKTRQQSIDSLKRKIEIIAKMKIMNQRIPMAMKSKMIIGEINNRSNRHCYQLVVRDKISRICKRHAVAKRHQNRVLKTLVSRESSAAAAAESGIQSIPLDVAANILFRLPVKSLARFRCVCKQWNSLTYDSHFVKEQHKRALETGGCMLIGRNLSTYVGMQLHKFEPDGQIKVSSFHINFTDEDGKPLHTRYTLSNSVNGLVGACCVSDVVPSYYLLNPTTRELSRLPGCSHHPARSLRCLGLGFDDSTGEYKLVRLHLKPNGNSHVFGTFSCEVLTVGTEEWRYVGDAPCNFISQTSVFLDGAFHWVAESSVDIILLAFDVKEEKFRFIPIPGIIHLYANSSILLSLRKLQGHICLVKPLSNLPGLRVASRVTRIWMLKNYANQEWKEEYIIDVSSWVNQTTYFFQIVDIKDGKVLMQNADKIYCYDLHRRTLDKLCDEAFTYADTITESLVSPGNLFRDL